MGPTVSELWKSDGTSAGTLLVRDIKPGLGDSRSRYLTNVNGTLYFRATDGSSGSELWKSDGTSAGTVQVRDLLPGLTGSLPSSLTNVNGRLYFAASDGTSGMELWSTDGTSAGTVRASDINPGAGKLQPGPIVESQRHRLLRRRQRHGKRTVASSLLNHRFGQHAECQRWT